jgi:hypothetical protein
MERWIDMDNIPEFPKKPSRPEDWPWSGLKDVITGTLAGQLPESVAERMKPDVLRMIDRAQEVSAGICSEETRAQLVELVAEMFTDRLMAETRYERERMRA